LLGTGAHAAGRIAPALAACEGCVLHGVAGSTPARAEAFAAPLPGVVRYPSYTAMLADKAIEAVFICTPNDQHRAQTEQAASAGKHVLVEKPMALTAQDCQAMIDACARAGVRLGVGFQQRHHPVHQELRRLITTGSLGEIVLLRAEWHTAYGPWRNWRADRSRAGSDILAAVGVHVFDLLCWLAGPEVTEVASIVDIAADTGQDQTLAASLRFAGGAIGTATITRRARTPASGIFVLGTKGNAGGPASLGMNATARMTLGDADSAQETLLSMPDLYAAQFVAFADAVARNQEPNASGADGLRSVLLADRLLAGV
jgi:1,5-anhydro-D-fructose reductase (1,5-anhydro-D-mannitol-forming)